MGEIHAKLLNIQSELKAPKSQYNSFGKYYYRSCEDILEAVKPLCKKYSAVLLLSDKIVAIEGRHYIEATATLIDTANGETVQVTASARESEDKKGMDSAQVTGATSSYARKYALNGLFDIDDTKDADTDAYTNQQEGSKSRTRTTKQKAEPQKVEQPSIAKTTLKDIEVLATEFAKSRDKQLIDVYKALQEKFNYTDITKLSDAEGKVLINALVGWNRQANRTAEAEPRR